VRDIQLYLAGGVPRGEVRQEGADTVVAALEHQLAPRLEESGAVIERDPLPPAVLDKPRLNDLFAVLVDNALIHARPLDPAQPLRIRISGERGDGLSRYRVADNGPGIRVEYRERVFEIFERLTAGDESGSGIGLSIARRIVESRHGRIWIEPGDQGGAAVVFELPDAG
jgi:light-regulated signal transduction histidine kinase (bacteriophytochrome)